MRKALALALLLAAAGAHADAIPMCDRVQVNFRSDDGGRVDADALRGAQNYMLEKLAERGYLAKFVAFYAPGEPLPVSRTSEIAAEAGDAPRVLIEIGYEDDFITRNLALRIYKLGSKPPYASYPVFNGNSTIGPVNPLGVNLRNHFRKLLRDPEMPDCASLAKRP